MYGTVDSIGRTTVYLDKEMVELIKACVCEHGKNDGLQQSVLEKMDDALRVFQLNKERPGWIDAEFEET